MLKTRLTEPRKVVSMLDPAMRQIDPQRRGAYVMSRNIEDLGDINAIEEKFAIFTLEPMKPNFQHLAGVPHLLFAAHCIAAENAPVSGSDFAEKDGRTRLKVESAEKIPLDVTMELGQVVLELASVDGDYASPFSSPVIEWVNRIREAERHDATRALMIDLAKRTHSKQSD